MKSLHFLVAVLFLGLTAPAHAAQYDIKEMTPRIQQALQSRQTRYEQIQNWKAQGVIGENNQGFVELRSTAAPDAGPAVQAENNDRRIIYEAIVQQNNLPASGMAQVEAAFADVQREKARPGDYIQTPAGQWVQK